MRIETKIIIVTRENIDTTLLPCLFEFGFLIEDITICTDVEVAFDISPDDVRLILFQTSNGDNIPRVQALYNAFTIAPIIILAGKEEEHTALELLQCGAQDFVVDYKKSLGVFRQTLNKALRRKQYSQHLYEGNRQLNIEIVTQKRQLDHILSSINEVVWSCTADRFETIYINDACYSIYGFSPNELIGNSDLLFGQVHPDDKKHYKNAWRELLQSGKSVFEYRIFHKDGSVKYIKNEAVLRKDSNNIPRFINGFARDVTIQKMQLLEIQKKNEQLQEIAWIQSHKVRGPVACILGFVQLFDLETADANNREVIGHLQSVANNLDLVIHEIVEKTVSLRP
jgi:PAS domain S-box-containing protein